MKRVVATAILVLAAPFAFAADIVAGGAKAKQVCAACHGEDGNGVQQFPDYPKLAGQHAEYLYHSLKAYKSGTRKHAVMAPMAAALTPQEMQDISAYFAAQKGVLHVKR